MSNAKEVKGLKVVKTEDFLGVQDLLRAQDIKRWTIVNMSRQQSLAEHIYNVVVIARAIAKELNIQDSFIIKYALDHDLDEVYTGDIPSPAKEKLGVRDHYAGKARGNCNAREVQIVLVADLIEAVAFANTHGLGRHAALVVDRLIDRLNQRISLYTSADGRFQAAIGQVISDMEHGEHYGE